MQIVGVCTVYIYIISRISVLGIAYFGKVGAKRPLPHADLRGNATVNWVSNNASLASMEVPVMWLVSQRKCTM